MIANGPGVDKVRVFFTANLCCVVEMTMIANDPSVVPPKGLKNGISYRSYTICRAFARHSCGLEMYVSLTDF